MATKRRVRDRRGVGRAFVLAAGSADPARDRGWCDDDSGAARFGEPYRWAQRGAEARPRAVSPGDEIPRCALRSQDGMRREPPNASMGQRRRSVDTDGQHADYREAFIAAQAYRRKWDKWNKDHQGDQPERSLRNETLAEVLRTNIYVHNHCFARTR